MTNQTVVLKSYKDGIRLILDPETDFSDLVKIIGDKFREARQFLGNADVVLALEGRELTDAQEMEILEVITLNCNLKVLCIIGQDERTQKSFLKAKKQLEKCLGDENGCRMFKGSLTDGQSLDIEESVVILGDVNPGCSVRSKGSIIVMGGLYGEAYAGGAAGEREFVTALEMSPEMLIIGGVIYEPSEKPRWGIKPKISPKIAFVSDGLIRLENLTRQALEKVYAF